MLLRCIGDLSTLQCKDTAKTTPWTERDGETCVRNPQDAQKSLLNRATALDEYVGWIVARWVTFFTKDDREAHVVRSGTAPCMSLALLTKLFTYLACAPCHFLTHNLFV